MERQASAVWNGTLKEGNGTMTAPSGVLKDARYTWAQRFANDPGTNPEELIAAAHAGCFSMAFAGKLTTAGFPPDRIATTATVTLAPHRHRPPPRRRASRRPPLDRRRSARPIRRAPQICSEGP